MIIYYDSLCVSYNLQAHEMVELNSREKQETENEVKYNIYK